MIGNLPLAPALLALALGAALAAAQQADQAPDQPGIAQDPNSAASDSAGGAIPARPAATNDSPFDYQASEKISEDLSVSFPVDI